MTDLLAPNPTNFAKRSSLQHVAMGLAYALKPNRLPDVLPLCRAIARDLLNGGQNKELPQVTGALERPDGYCGLVRDLDPETLNEAYARGLFPFSHIGPIKWWSPKSRAVLFFDQYKVDKNVRRRLRNNQFTITFDTAFTEVIRACAEPRPGTRSLTWINDRIISAYTRVHRQGAAHSVEVWDENGDLAGGAYGYAVGRVFFTESQFHRKRDASKAGFAVLNRHLQHWGYAFNDGKDQTGHLQSMGFASIPRDDFTLFLDVHARVASPKPGRWKVDRDLDVAGWVPNECDGLTTSDVFAERFGTHSFNWLPDAAKEEIA